MIQTQERFYRPAKLSRQVEGFDTRKFTSMKHLSRELDKLGIGMDEFDLHGIVAADKRFAQKMRGTMDAIEPTVTTGSMPVPVQFLQQWLPGFVYIITAAMNIDDFVGMSTMGKWHQEEIVQGILELTGKALPYGDYANNNLSSWNPNYERRTIVRFEQAMQIGLLEEARAAEAQINDSGSKREAAALALEIQRNNVGFFGYDGGANRTYGLLNDPNLPAYVTVPNGASGSPLWSSKTFLEISRDIRSALASLRNQSKDRIDPSKVDITLGVASIAVDYMSTTSDFGISVTDWLKQAYPRVRVVSAPELTGANGGANVFYLFADSVKDQSTDDGRTFIQVVPAKYQTLGVEQKVKGYIEGYTNATAGVMCKRPYAVVRRSGI